MTADHSSDAGRQRTVAELLQQYGGEAGSSGRRRRRAADAEPEEPTAARAEEPPPAPAEQTWSSFSALEGDEPGIPPSSTGASPTQLAAADREADSLWADYRSPGLSGYVPRGGYSSDGYRADSYQPDGYPADHTKDAPPADDYPPEDYPARDYGAQGYAGQGYAAQDYAAKNHAAADYSPADYAATDYPPADFGAKDYGAKDYRVKDYRANDHPADDYEATDYPGGYPTGSGGTGHHSSVTGSRADWSRFGRTDPARSSPPAAPGQHPGGDALAERYTAPEERTEQLPRYQANRSAPGPATGPITDWMPRSARPVDDSGPSTMVSSRAELFDEEDDAPVAPGQSLFDVPAGLAPGDLDEHGEIDEHSDEPVAEQGEAEPRAPAKRRGRRGSPTKSGAATEQAEEDAAAEPTASLGRTARGRPASSDSSGRPESGAEADEPAGGLKAWAILIAQGIGGAVGGALLWVGFRYLWLNVPVLALAAAVAATVGLVLVVRAIRGSDELQTTILAVLVGLIVTISPAVLLLTLR